MQLPLLLVSLPLLALASPLDPLVTKRQCTSIFPSTTISLSKPAGSASNTKDLSFTVPPGVWGCTLIAAFPAGYPIASSGNSQVNVIDVNGPSPGAIVGTVTFASDPREGTTRWINSFACRGDMKYRLVLAAEAASGAASVSFANGNGAGVALRYGC